MLKQLKTSEIAKISYEKSFAVVADNLEQAVEISEKRAPEHLELCIENAQAKVGYVFKLRFFVFG